MDMRKLLTVIGAIGIITAAFAGSAAAAQDDWTVLITAGSGGNYSSPSNGTGARVQLGTKPGANDSETVMDGFDGGAIPPQIAQPAYVALYRPDWTVIGAVPEWAKLKDYKAPLELDQYGKAEIKTYNDIIVWAAPGYSQPTINLYLWTTASAAPPTDVSGQPVAYKLQMTYAPEGYDGPTEWLLDTPGTGLLKEIVLPALAGAKTANPIVGVGGLEATQVAGYRFNFVTPEPGSMMVLASGLTGLMGLVARRRKA